MRSRRREVAAVGLFLLATLLATEPLRADGDEGVTKPVATDRAASPARAVPKSADPFPLSEELQDPGFSRYVDLKLLSTAWREMDAALMADVALQLASGEEALQRPHQALNSRQVAELAAQLAIETNQPETIDRLIRAAKARNNDALANALNVTRKLASTSRGDSPAPVSIDDLSTTEVALLKTWMGKIKSAKLAADREALNQLDSQIPKIIDLKDKQRQALKEMVAEATRNLPEGKSEPSSVSKLLDKLSAGNRPGPQAYQQVVGGNYSSRFQVQFTIQLISIPGYDFYAARLTSPPPPGSPFDQIGLALGDVVVRLDGIPVTNANEMDNHYGQTFVRFIKAGTTWVQNGTVYLGGNGFPSSGGGGVSP
ncbi:hypothetical protein [Singulisphaera acidiphila]|uniref:PDZ domain-containing protein n=1 Tax=Singulisphaera acidiphila (strain ATCC BAA-1392 / DSM 18658 / VKM B-2454 / MOB10) TaxID=886293 RepID=L0DFD3_SINAD|nr:hypothetical protein [Singulisphaera acidiphila]AGA27967.1 hypothetical protein Sinac_3729 [Singulisphaera acidiphila DSM 18658]